MRNPNITRWLQEQQGRHSGLAKKHEKTAWELGEALEQYQKQGTLPKAIRKKWSTRKRD